MQTYILRVDTEIFGETLTAHATEADARKALTQIIEDGASKRHPRIGNIEFGGFDDIAAAFERVFADADQFSITPVDVPGVLSERLVETAMCIWEWVCDVTLDDSPQCQKDWVELRENIGAMEMRWQCMDLARWLDQVYDIVHVIDDGFFGNMSFDWEVVPAIMSFARNEEGPAIYSEHLPSPQGVAKLLVTKCLRDRWVKDAKLVAAYEHGYAEMLEEGAHFFEEEMLAGTMPREAVRRYAEAYDLITRDPISKSGDRMPSLGFKEDHFSLLNS